MIRPLAAYVATAVAFLLLDAGWLSLVGPRLYRPELGSLLADKVRIAPAVIFYLLYVGGLVWFCVAPNLEGDWRRAAVSGAVLGLVAYGAYDLTCAATMRVWSLKVTLADLAWGAFASAAASAAATAIVHAILRGRGA